MKKSQKPVPAIDLLLPAAKLIKDNVPVFFLLLVIPMLLTAQTGTPEPLSQDATLKDIFVSFRDMVTPLAAVGSFLSLFFYPFLTFAYHQAAKSGTTSLKEVAKGGTAYYWQLLGIFLLTCLVAAAGLMFFIVPGLIAIRSFILAPFYLIDSRGKLGVIGALKKSAQESKPFKWSIYSVIGLVVLFGIFGSFGLVGQIAGTVLGMLYAPAFALRYREIAR